MNFYESIADIRHHIQHNLSLYGKHDEFKKNYVKLFTMLCDPNCDQAMVEKMINLHKKRHTGKITQENADIAFGTVAAEKYVHPLVSQSSQT